MHTIIDFNLELARLFFLAYDHYVYVKFLQFVFEKMEHR